MLLLNLGLAGLICLGGCSQINSEATAQGPCPENMSRAECQHIVSVSTATFYDVAPDDEKSFVSIMRDVKRVAKAHNGRVIDESDKSMRAEVKFRNAEDANAFIENVLKLTHVKRAAFDPDVDFH